jgi:AP-2 complex subunit alpha
MLIFVLFLVKARQPNIRYLGLEAMSRLVASRDVQRVVRDHQQTGKQKGIALENFLFCNSCFSSAVIDSLKETDVSIRKRALDLLYSMCDAESAQVRIEKRKNAFLLNFFFFQTIVRQLLDYLAKAEYEVRRELASKTAILAEKFSSNKAWYIDCMLEVNNIYTSLLNCCELCLTLQPFVSFRLKLLRIAGEDVPDDMWHRVIRVVLSSSEDAQAYAARTCLRVRKKRKSWWERFS